jgi:metallo-beta-lactamase class B
MSRTFSRRSRSALELAIGGLILIATACMSRPSVPSDAIAQRHDVFVQPIGPNAWRHVSFRWFPGMGPIPSNGLIVRVEDEKALLIDTGWNSRQTAFVLDWAEKNVGPVSALLITHAHDDRIGGIAEVHDRGVRSIALQATVDQALDGGWPRIQEGVESGFRLDSLGVRGELFFPGHAHSADNAVVYLDDERILAGSCMIRELAARSLGNTSDADLAYWPDAVRTLQTRYPLVELVVPGHGHPGGQELLGHTLDLLAAHDK